MVDNMINNLVYDKNADSIIKILNDKGHKAYYVGGCVRDSIMGNIPHDFDIATSAMPCECIEIFRDYGFNVIETGIKHGTVTVIINHLPYEVTTFRIDGEYKDKRHPESVRFVGNLKEDIARRDFTVNALAYHPKEGLIDFFEGQEDIKNKVIRCVGEPEKRFEEDALRILRALRFAARFNFTIEYKTSEAVKKCCVRLKDISAERVYAELCGILISQKPADIIREYLPVFGVLIPELLPAVNFRQNSKWHIYDVFEHTMSALDNTPADINIRLAVLFHDLGKPLVYTQDELGCGHFKGHQKVSCDIARKIMRRLKADNKTTDSVCNLVLHHDDRIPVTREAIIGLIRRMGREDALRAVYVEMADNMAQKQDMVRERACELKVLKDELEKQLNSDELCVTVSDLDISGSDIISAGIPAGPLVGKVLSFLLDAVTEGKASNSRQELLEYMEYFTF